MSAPAQTNGPEEGIARDLARRRAANISDLRYRLNLELEPAAPRLKGRVEIHLHLADASQPLALDFRDLDDKGRVIDGPIRDVTINGTPVKMVRQVNGHLVLAAEYFHKGDNTIALAFDSGIAAANRPLIRYHDRDDDSEYIHTLFVPMDASLAFPCFDQPDLKAKFTLDIVAPEAWTIISNTPIDKTSPSDKKGYRRTEFKETLPLSTYLFAFAAGPFRELAGDKGEVPLRLFVRKSQEKRAAEEWPEVQRLTRAGLAHQAAFFDHPFPFAKYDSVLIPGFAYGGMEHAGATFFREDLVLFRSTPTENDKLRRAGTILHELAHQWFGDLVTMRWFDDLWLKEGFADYMAYHTLATLYPPETIWKRFYEKSKVDAYAIDATEGTTPVHQDVPNLKDAKSAYGAIVYKKAPSLLRSLSFLLGEEKFRAGVRGFVKKYAWKNAEWSDLIASLEEASGQSLKGWAEAWLHQRGMPQVDVEWSADSRGLIDKFELRQHDVLGTKAVWPIKTQVLLAYDDGKFERLTVQFDGKSTTVREAIGKKRPHFVFGNEDDQAYGRFLLDKHSRAVALVEVGRQKNAFLRTLLWGALWDAVREAELPPLEFFKRALESLGSETDRELVQTLLDHLTVAYLRYLAPTEQTARAASLEDALYDGMLKSADLSLRIAYFRAFRHVAKTAKARGRLKDVLGGKTTIPGFEVKPVERWQIIGALLARNDEEADTLFKQEKQRDTSDDGRKYAYLAEAARADAATKKRYFDDYLHNRDVSEDWVQASLPLFNAWDQEALTKPYVKAALAALPQMKRERKIFFVLAWLDAFLGGQTSQEALEEVKEFLRDDKLDADLRRKVLEAMNELERTVRIRAK